MNKIIADANRYRWLRDRSENAIIDIVSARTWVTVKGYKKQLDDLIDRELSKATPECLEMAEVITEPQKKEWQGLTEVERMDILDAELTTQSTEHFALAQAIEAKLKLKNGYAEEKNSG
jgi:hypothetical protein